MRRLHHNYPSIMIDYCKRLDDKNCWIPSVRSILQDLLKDIALYHDILVLRDDILKDTPVIPGKNLVHRMWDSLHYSKIHNEEVFSEFMYFIKSFYAMKYHSRIDLDKYLKDIEPKIQKIVEYNIKKHTELIPIPFVQYRGERTWSGEFSWLQRRIVKMIDQSEFCTLLRSDSRYIEEELFLTSHDKHIHMVDDAMYEETLRSIYNYNNDDYSTTVIPRIHRLKVKHPDNLENVWDVWMGVISDYSILENVGSIATLPFKDDKGWAFKENTYALNNEHDPQKYTSDFI